MGEDKNTPFAVRMEQEDKEKLVQLIQESGKSNKEFMNVLMSAYELNRVKVEIPEATESIKKVEELTQLINDYFVNMSKQIKITKESLNLQFTKDIGIYKEKIEVLTEENGQLESKALTLQDAFNNIYADNEELKKELLSKDALINQLQESINDKTELVEEYKGKNDMLLSNLKQYESYPEQLNTTKELLTDAQSKNLALENTIKDKDSAITKLNTTLEELKVNNEAALNELREKQVNEIENIRTNADLEKKQELLELKQQQQEKDEQLREEFNAKINEYQAKYKALLEELTNIKNSKKTTPSKSKSINSETKLK